MQGCKRKESAAILTAMSQLEPIIAPAVEAAGYRLVRLRLMGDKRKTLQIMAERADGLMDVDDCTKLSRALSEFLDTQDVIDGGYLLEVSSPGIDRPLVRRSDFDRYAGNVAHVEMATLIDGRRRFRGLLLGTDGGSARIRVDRADDSTTDVLLPIDAMSEARLVLTDALIAESLRRSKHGDRTDAETTDALNQDQRMSQTQGRLTNGDRKRQ